MLYICLLSDYFYYSLKREFYLEFYFLHIIYFFMVASMSFVSYFLFYWLPSHSWIPCWSANTHKEGQKSIKFAHTHNPMTKSKVLITPTMCKQFRAIYVIFVVYFLFFLLGIKRRNFSLTGFPSYCPTPRQRM